MIKYIGSKRALLPWILSVVKKLRALEAVRTAADPFSGSARVAHALKAMGLYVIAGDYATYAYVLAKALVEANAREYPRERVEPILRELSALPPRRGWFTRTYCLEARYFQPENGERIEAIREAIEAYAEDQGLWSILLASLILGADRVDSTVGVQMAYLKRPAPRAHRPLTLSYPPLLPGKGEAYLGDALEWVGELEVDLLYLDPPYNSHSYLGNYHLWETLVLWDQPEVYGKAKKRADVRWRKSPFNSKRLARDALERLVARAQARHILLSFSDEGHLSPYEIEEILGSFGYLRRFSRSHKRYIGWALGVYNPKGERVGAPSHERNQEFLFLATKSRRVFEATEDLEGWGSFKRRGS